MVNEQHKEHFWIPDSEVTRVGKKPTARGKSYNKDFAVHGAKLGESLSSIKRAIESVVKDLINLTNICHSPTMHGFFRPWVPKTIPVPKGLHADQSRTLR